MIISTRTAAPVGTALATALVVLAASTSASARQWSAACTNLAGMTVEDGNTAPVFADVSVKGATWVYKWNTATKKATLTLPASHSSDGKPHIQNGEVNAHRGGFFTIVTLLPGAVWTHAIYPEAGRLLATQSTTSNGTTLAGRMLVGTCTISE